MSAGLSFGISVIWGISTVGRTSLPYFIPKTVKVGQGVNGESAQNLPRKFGALAQLVARNVRIVEVRGSNPLRSTTSLPVLQQSRQGFFIPLALKAPVAREARGVLRSYMMRGALYGIENPTRMAEVAVCGWNVLFLHDISTIPCYTPLG